MNRDVYMKFVLDTSVIIAVITNEEHKAQLVKITEGAELIAHLQCIGRLEMHFQQCSKKKGSTIQAQI